jgi:hypothetical protein
MGIRPPVPQDDLSACFCESRKIRIGGVIQRMHWTDCVKACRIERKVSKTIVIGRILGVHQILQPAK